MTIEIKVPVLPESVADATIAAWHKKPGDAVSRDENIVDIETDKVVLEVVAPADGVLEAIMQEEGATVLAEQVIGTLKEGASAPSESSKSSESNQPAEKKPVTAEAKVEVVNAQEVVKAKAPPATENKVAKLESTADSSIKVSPSVRRMLAENNLTAEDIVKEGRIYKADVMQHLSGEPSLSREEKRVPMTRLRARIAERLLEAQQTAAILTTFNEINMQPVMDLRGQYKDVFEKKHGVRLGFMSFFIKACTEALKEFPVVNASIDGNDIVYHGYCDIGVAVASPRGLVVPVVRNAEQLSMAELEATVAGLGRKAKDGQLSIEDMTGGTFTISNGGVFGSLLSTPILNPPQTGILGMHKIEERAVVEDGQVVVRPMMYVALSYDHRIIDGSESVRFLVRVKELLEDPARLVLGV